MKRVLLDTDACVQFLNGSGKVFNALSDAESVFISIFVLSELFYGFNGSTKEAGNKKLLAQLLEKPTVSVIHATEETAEIFGFIKHEMDKVGTHIPIHDVWIASHTLETGSTLITFNTHFSNIPGLRVWDEIS